MIRAPSLVEFMKNQELPSARTENSSEEASVSSAKSHTLLGRVVSSGNSSSVGSQSLNSARVLTNTFSPREEEDPHYKAAPMKSLTNLETLAEEGGPGDDESSAAHSDDSSRPPRGSESEKEPLLKSAAHPASSN